MTAPHSPLVRRVAEAIAASIYRSEGLETMNYAGVEDYSRREWEHYAAKARAALDACHAEEMLAVIRGFQAKYDFGDHLPDDHPVTSARALLAKLEGRV